MDKTIAFIGTGYMGSTLLKAVCRAISPLQVVIADHDRKKARELADELGCAVAESNAAAAEQAEYVLLCVKPQVLPGVMREIAPVMKNQWQQGNRQILASIAAGMQISDLRALLGCDGLPIIRLMPNSPALVGAGLMFFTTDGVATDEQVSALQEIMRLSGATERIDEKMIDQATVLASCSPAYFYMCIEAMADGGVMLGLPRQKAQAYAAQAMAGAAAMALETGLHPGALKDIVCSPGGSTIVGVAKLEEAGLRSTMIQAVLAAYDRNVQLGEYGKK